MPGALALIAPTLAADGGDAALVNLGIIALIFVVFYFLLIRPQRQQQKRHRELVSSLQNGDEVITVGGLHGTIRTVDDDVVSMEIAPGTTVTVSRGRIFDKKTEDEPDIGDTG